MASPRSLGSRIALAIALMVGFYVLAVGISMLLLYLPYAEWRYAHRVHAKLAIFCIIGAVIILHAIVPRRDRFDAPGPRLESDRYPELFRNLNAVAEATGQTMPAEVYLVSDMNAWVAERGGMMGVGSRRVMGLGLPLMQVLTVSQLRAVLAHEFGHFHGGDTKLGPWVYKTRGAIGRTLMGLSGHSAFLQKPFEWYGLGFLRLTHAVSRNQELTADALAARVAGAQSLIEGLKRIHGAALAFHWYVRNEVFPVIERRFAPPLAEGFEHFISSPLVAHVVNARVEEEVEEEEGKGNPYDTHPPLSARIAALSALPQGAAEGTDPIAVTLLGDVRNVEHDLARAFASKATGPLLKPISWEEVGPKVWVGNWEKMLDADDRAALAAVTCGSLHERLKDTATFTDSIMREGGRGMVPAEDRLEMALFVAGAALAMALFRSGWRMIYYPPGEETVLESGQTRIKPFELVKRLAAGAIDAEEWQRLCASAGIESLTLAPAETRSE